MQKFGIVSDKPLEEWQKDLVHVLEELSAYRVNGLALVALVEPEDPEGDDVLAFYNRMSVRDKQLAAAVIEGDVHYAIAQAAIARAMGEEDAEEWE